MVAMAIRAVTGGAKLPADEKSAVGEARCSDERRELAADGVRAAKAAVTAALRNIKPYDGPSRIWFAYQAKLSEGCGWLAAIVSGLPVGVVSPKF
jgi:hypothetical protein